MKTIELISLLTPEEIRKISFVLKMEGKEELEKLWEFCRERDLAREGIDKKALFAALQGRPFRTSDDQWLRTRLSQFNKWLEGFLTKEHAERMLSQVTSGEEVLLRVFLERGRYAIFEKSWKQAVRRADRQQRHDQLVGLYRLYFEYVRHHLGVDLEKLKVVKGRLEQAIRQNRFHFLETHGSITYALAYIDRILRVADRELAGDTLPPVPEAEPSDDWPLHIRFLFEWGQSYYLQGEEKIRRLEQLLAWREKTLRFPLEKKQQHAYLLATIALEYFFLREYERANDYYQQVFQLTGKDPEPYFLDILYNYFSNLLASEQFRKAAGYYQRYETAILQSRRHAFRFQFLAALAHLFLEETSRAFEIMSQDIYQLPEYESVYGRIIFAFIYYQWREYEQSERELHNLLQKIRYKAPPFPDIEMTARLFQKFLRGIDKPLGRQERQAQKTDLLTEIDAAAGPAHNVFLLKCLRREVEQFE